MSNINIEDINNTNDDELIMLYLEDDEYAKEILFHKYKYIIDVLIKKYLKKIDHDNIDIEDLYSEANVGFSDALNSYIPDKDASLPTFITLCIERRFQKVLKKYCTTKFKLTNEVLSLDFIYENNQKLIDFINSSNYDPLVLMNNHENYKELVNNIINSLTELEYEVFLLYIDGNDYHQIADILNKNDKQIDNTIQRIKNKIKKIVLV